VQELLAYVGAELKKPEEEISDELVFLINSRIKPPQPVTREEIYVRTMFLVSDEVNSYGGRFPSGELLNICELVIDSPVIVGHTKDKLPIARNFKAEVVQKDGRNWVKVWFYWLKNARDALSLKENIDHGIYKECSLGFVFGFPECSICGEDMRRCQHIPFKTYKNEEKEKKAYFNYRNIIRVLETSLVYRGAVPNTSMSDELWLCEKRNSQKRCEDSDCSSISLAGRIHELSPLRFVPPAKPKKSRSTANEFFHLEDLHSFSGEFLIEPKYDGVRTQIHKREKEVKVFTDQGKPIEQKLPRLVKEILQNPEESFILDGELVKYRGNSRLSRKEVVSHIYGDPGASSSKGDDQPDDSRFKFKLFDLLYLNGEDKTSLSLEERKRLLEYLFPQTNLIQKVKHEKVSSGDLASRIKSVASSEGAMIKKADSGYFEEEGWYKWKRHLELDVLVTGAERNKGGTCNYTCAVGTSEGSTAIGNTYSTPVAAQVGEIIRVRVDYVIEAGEGFTWHAPRVLYRRPEKKEPDPISVLQRMIGREMSADRRRSTAGEDIEATDGKQRTADKFVLQVHWWGKAKHHDLRFQEGNVAFGLTVFQLDLDELSRGKRFLCEWKDCHDTEWMDFEGDIPPEEGGTEGDPSRSFVAHMKILDKGKYEILERKTDFVSLKIEGKVLNGTYLARKVRLKGKDRWLFWRRSTDRTDEKALQVQG
jgi:hypothetical protein